MDVGECNWGAPDTALLTSGAYSAITTLPAGCDTSWPPKIGYGDWEAHPDEWAIFYEFLTMTGARMKSPPGYTYYYGGSWSKIMSAGITSLQCGWPGCTTSPHVEAGYMAHYMAFWPQPDGNFSANGFYYNYLVGLINHILTHDWVEPSVGSEYELTWGVNGQPYTLAWSAEGQPYILNWDVIATSKKFDPIFFGAGF